MEEKKRQRCIYVTARQKKKLIELMNKHPELISCKVTQDFNYGDSHKLWQNIANECNAIPGAKKTWRQWRKTWHDIRSKTKKKQAEINGELPISTVILASEQEGTLDIKNNSCNEDYHRTPEFIPLSDSQHDIFSEDMSAAFISEPESPPESKVFNTHEHRSSQLELKNPKHSQKKSENCYFNCEVLAVQEQRKIQIKEDYLNFKKDYLTQKLKLIKEQTEALKNIAKELSK